MRVIPGKRRAFPTGFKPVSVKTGEKELKTVQKDNNPLFSPLS